MRPLLLLGLAFSACYDDPVLINPYERTTASQEVDRTRQVDVPPENCGNGEVDSDEQCDDGNRIDNDGCSNVCQERTVTSGLLARPIIDAVAGSRRFERNDQGQVVLAPFQAVRFSGRDSTVPHGEIAAYEWSLDAADGGLIPAGSQVFFDDASKDRPRLMYSVRGNDRPGVDLIGNYRVALRVQDAQGTWSRFASVAFESRPNRALWIELNWDKDSHDVDLHLIRTGDRNLAFDRQQDCFFSNCIPRSPGVASLNWGSSSAGDDPFLDVDDVDGFGPEVISVPAPENDMDYLIALHMFRLDIAAATTVSLKVLIDGEVVAELSRELPSQNDWWEAVRLRWGEEVEVDIVDEHFDDAPNQFP